MIYLSEADYHTLRDEYSGICLSCFSVKHGDTEPDAENYQCESCEKFRVQGIDNLLIMGLVSMDLPENKAPFVKLKNRKTGLVSERKIQF